MNYFVYILTNYTNTTFYIGVTNNISRRVYEHRNKIVKGFTSTYNLKKLIFYEEYNDINEAIKREKYLKNWKRQWKIDLVKSINPNMEDLLTDAESSSA